MAYKTILVHIDTSKRANDTIKIAIDMAISCDAHLIGIAATGLSGLSYLAGERAADHNFLFLRRRVQRGRSAGNL